MNQSLLLIKPSRALRLKIVQNVYSKCLKVIYAKERKLLLTMRTFSHSKPPTTRTDPFVASDVLDSVKVPDA